MTSQLCSASQLSSTKRRHLLRALRPRLRQRKRIKKSKLRHLFSRTSLLLLTTNRFTVNEKSALPENIRRTMLGSTRKETNKRISLILLKICKLILRTAKCSCPKGSTFPILSRRRALGQLLQNKSHKESSLKRKKWAQSRKFKKIKF